MTKLIFMGTPDFSATVLKGLLTDNRYEILAVVTQPDRAVGRKKVIQETPVKQAAKDGRSYEARSRWNCDCCIWAVSPK